MCIRDRALLITALAMGMLNRPASDIVAVTMSLAGRFSIPMARAVISRARVESSPPERRCV